MDGVKWECGQQTSLRFDSHSGLCILPMDLWTTMKNGMSSLREQTGECEDCEQADQQTALVRCLECEENYCAAHGDLHKKLKMSRHHRVVGLEEVGRAAASGNRLASWLSTIKCSQHPHLNVDCWCVECKMFSCSECFVVQHNGHKMEEINEWSGLIEEAMNEMKEAMNKLVKLQERVKVMREQLHLQVVQASDGWQSVHEQIDEAFDLMVAECERRRGEMHRQVDERSNGQTKLIESRMEEVRQMEVEVEAAQEFADERLKSGRGNNEQTSQQLLIRLLDLLLVVDVCD